MPSFRRTASLHPPCETGLDLSQHRTSDITVAITAWSQSSLTCWECWKLMEALDLSARLCLQVGKKLHFLGEGLHLVTKAPLPSAVVRAWSTAIHCDHNLDPWNSISDGSPRGCAHFLPLKADRFDPRALPWDLLGTVNSTVKGTVKSVKLRN